MGEVEAQCVEGQPNSSLEAHGCGLGTLTIGALVTKGSGPNGVRSLVRSRDWPIECRFTSFHTQINKTIVIGWVKWKIMWDEDKNGHMWMRVRE